MNLKVLSIRIWRFYRRDSKVLNYERPTCHTKQGRKHTKFYQCLGCLFDKIWRRLVVRKLYFPSRCVDEWLRTEYVHWFTQGNDVRYEIAWLQASLLGFLQLIIFEPFKLYSLNYSFKFKLLFYYIALTDNLWVSLKAWVTLSEVVLCYKKPLKSRYLPTYGPWSVLGNWVNFRTFTLNSFYTLC